MGKINSGLQNEIDIINAFNHKRFNELTPNLAKISQYILPSIKKHVRFKAKKCNDIAKPDICLKYANQKYFISVKCNHSCYLHSEKIKDFILYLRKFNVSIATQKIVLFFQFGDGTLDGSGTTRLRHEDLMIKYGKYFEFANKELNENKELVLDFLDKVMFRGNEIHKEHADFIYHGNVEDGVICSKKSVLRYVGRRKFDSYRTLHIGPVTMSPYARYVTFNELHPEKRFIINFHWHNLEQSLSYINKYFDS